MTGSPPSSQARLRTLYVEHHGWLHTWLCRKLTCRADAADLAHDTFLRAWHSPQFERIEEPRAFLTLVAKRVLLSFWRRGQLEQAYRETLASLPPTWVPSEEEFAQLREALEAIDRMLDGLPENVRRAFLLSRLEGLTYLEIAAQLEVSLATVERWMKRALTHCFLVLQDTAP